jgi:hypothetical protein
LSHRTKTLLQELLDKTSSSVKTNKSQIDMILKRREIDPKVGEPSRDVNAPADRLDVAAYPSLMIEGKTDEQELEAEWNSVRDNSLDILTALERLDEKGRLWFSNTPDE